MSMLESLIKLPKIDPHAGAFPQYQHLHVSHFLLEHVRPRVDGVTAIILVWGNDHKLRASPSACMIAVS